MPRTLTQSIPEYLQPYIAKQDPSLYTPIDHAAWRFILRISQAFFAEHAHQKYFVQKVAVSEELRGRSRMDVFGPLCQGKRVLHVGCVDWPITDLKASLHLQLEPLCAQLDGFDINTEAFAHMQPHLKGRLFSDWAAVTDRYDLVLVPEVLEHVPDVQGFLGQLDAVDCDEYVLTVPDAYSCWRQHFDYSSGAQTFVEVVHPVRGLLPVDSVGVVVHPEGTGGLLAPFGVEALPQLRRRRNIRGSVHRIWIR